MHRTGTAASTGSSTSACRRTRPPRRHGSTPRRPGRRFRPAWDRRRRRFRGRRTFAGRGGCGKVRKGTAAQHPAPPAAPAVTGREPFRPPLRLPSIRPARRNRHALHAPALPHRRHVRRIHAVACPARLGAGGGGPPVSGHWLGFVAATLTTAAFVPQALKTLRSRATRGVSLGMYVIFPVGLCFWLAYG